MPCSSYLKKHNVMGDRIMRINMLESLADNIVIDKDKCTFCGICVDRCVLDNLRMKLAPCRQACPLGVNCHGYVQTIARGEEEKGIVRCPDASSGKLFGEPGAYPLDELDGGGTRHPLCLSRRPVPVPGPAVPVRHGIPADSGRRGLPRSGGGSRGQLPLPRRAS